MAFTEFKELRPGEFFSSSHFIEDIKHKKVVDPEIPWLYERVSDSNKALFLPTGFLRKFPASARVSTKKVEIRYSTEYSAES
jgi:hypothetical protein